MRAAAPGYERRRRAGEVAGIACAVVAALFMAGSWLLATRFGISTLWISGEGPDLVIPITIGGVGAVIVARQRHNIVGWLFLATGVVDSVRSFAGEYAINGLRPHSMFPGYEWAAWLSNWLLAVIFPAGSFLLLLLVFPNGRLPSRRWRWLVAAAAVATALSVVVSMVDPTPITMRSDLPSIANPTGIGGLPSGLTFVVWLVLWPLGFALLLCAAAAPFVRYRRADGENRQQLKWFAFATGVTAVLLAAAFVLTIPLSSDLGQGVFNLVTIAGIGVSIPVACGIAILKYRLYGIDVVISRTLVYGSLAAVITGVYVGIAVGIGELVGSGGKPNLGLSILATAIVAVGFQPARERLQRIANRLVYGKRATPYQVLSQFSSQVAGSYAADEVLPRMARVLQEGTGAESTVVWLRSGDALPPAAWWPLDSEAATAVPHISVEGVLPSLPGATRAVAVRHQGELLGALSVTKRRNESLTPVEEKLLDDLAHQAGLVLKNVGLTADLQRRLEELRASRQRLVSAQDAERRRLERNLHDGAQQNLVALKVKLGLAEILATKDPEKAKATLQQLKDDADEALETLRDLARGIYPPLLAEKGLATAIESQAHKATVAVEVDTDGVGRYEQDVEATVYFCVLEALQNVQKYADASAVTIRLRERNSILSFEVEDNGRGFDVDNVRKGAGLTNMQDRLDAIGGRVEIRSSQGVGTTVCAQLPRTGTVPATQRELAGAASGSRAAEHYR